MVKARHTKKTQGREQDSRPTENGKSRSLDKPRKEGRKQKKNKVLKKRSGRTLRKHVNGVKNKIKKQNTFIEQEKERE